MSYGVLGIAEARARNDEHRTIHDISAISRNPHERDELTRLAAHPPRIAINSSRNS